MYAFVISMAPLVLVLLVFCAIVRLRPFNAFKHDTEETLSTWTTISTFTVDHTPATGTYSAASKGEE